MPAEFDRYASAGYSALLSDSIRGKFGASEFFDERKLVFIREFYERYRMKTELASWLDVGCGEGALLRMGKRYFRAVVGCDVSAGMIEHCEGLNVLQQDSPRQIPFEDRSFDLVTAICVYHHVESIDRLALTSEIVRVMKSRGIFCVIEHNPLNPVTQLVVHRSPIDSHAHLMTARKVRRLMRDARMELLTTRYFLFLPERFYSKMAGFEAKLSGVPLGGQYGVFCQKA